MKTMELKRHHISQEKRCWRDLYPRNYFFLFGARWESAEPAADLAALLNLRSLKMLEDVLATFELVLRCFLGISDSPSKLING